MAVVVAEGQVAAVEVKEDQGEHKEDEDRCASEAEDETEVGFIGECLFYVIKFHTSVGCRILS